MKRCFVDELSLIALVAIVLSLPICIFSQNLLDNFSCSFNYRRFHRRDCFVVWFQFAVCYCHSYLRCNSPKDIRLPFLARTVAKGTTAGHVITVYAFDIKDYAVGHVLCNLLYGGSRNLIANI